MKLKFWKREDRPLEAAQKAMSGQEFWAMFQSLIGAGPETGIAGWVYACMSRISQDISTAIVEIYDGDRPIDHRLYEYLAAPNPYNLREFLFQSTWLLLSEGRAIWWITDEYMIPLPGAQPVISQGSLPRITGYRVGTLSLGLENLLVVARYNPADPTKTICPLRALEDVIGADQLTWQWTRNILAKWWHVQYGVRIPADLPGSAAEKIVQEIRILHEGPEKAGRPAVLPPGTELLPLATQNPGEMAGRMPYDPIRDRILGVFGVPASVLGLVKDVNRANAEASRQVYRENTLAPILALIAEGLTGLTSRFGKPAQVYLTLPISPDPDALRESVIELAKSDIITINEARRELGYEDVSWGDMPLGVLRILAQQGYYTPSAGKGLPRTRTKGIYRREALRVKRQLEREAHGAYSSLISELWSRIASLSYVDFPRRVRDILYEARGTKPGIGAIRHVHVRAFQAGLSHGRTQLGKAAVKQDTRPMEVSLQRAERSYALTLDAVERELLETFPEGLTDEEFADWLAQRYELLHNTTAIYAARLSVTSEFCDGQLTSFAEEGVPAKTWLTTGDDRVRDTHMEMEGITVPLPEDFILPSGARGPAPGLLDDDGENWNCRCILAPDVGGI